MNKILSSIRTRRKAAHLTQEQLGLLMGYSKATAKNRISQYEIGYRMPKIDTLTKMDKIISKHE